jgi:hypothetical protein
MSQGAGQAKPGKSQAEQRARADRQGRQGRAAGVRGCRPLSAPEAIECGVVWAADWTTAEGPRFLQERSQDNLAALAGAGAAGAAGQQGQPGQGTSCRQSVHQPNTSKVL